MSVGYVLVQTILIVPRVTSVGYVLVHTILIVPRVIDVSYVVVHTITHYSLCHGYLIGY